jgi:hypothetical protein
VLEIALVERLFRYAMLHKVAHRARKTDHTQGTKNEESSPAPHSIRNRWQVGVYLGEQVHWQIGLSLL